MNKTLSLGLAALLCLAAEPCFGQSSSTQVVTQAQADKLLLVFQQQQRLIVQAFSELMLQGPTPQEIADWHSENAAVQTSNIERWRWGRSRRPNPCPT